MLMSTKKQAVRELVPDRGAGACLPTSSEPADGAGDGDGESNDNGTSGASDELVGVGAPINGGLAA